MEVNSKDFLELAEQLYHEYKFIGISKTDFLEHVKKEVQAYTKEKPIASPEDQMELMYQIIENLPKPAIIPSEEDHNKKLFLSREEERELLEKAVGGDLEARRILIEKNEGLVKSQARRYIGRGQPLEDLVQEGMIALLYAISKYDLTKQNKFSSYAVPCIDGKLLDYLAETGAKVRFPKNIPDYLKKVNELAVKLQREPSIEEIAEDLNISKKAARRVIEWRSSTISIETVIDEERKTEFGSLIAAEDLYSSCEMRADVDRLLETLSDKEQQVLIMMYGLYGVRIYTKKEIATLMKVTPQRVSNIEATALRKLRRLDQIMDMSIYMDDPEAARENILFYREQYKSPKNTYKKHFERPKTKVKKENHIC